MKKLYRVSGMMSCTVLASDTREAFDEVHKHLEFLDDLSFEGVDIFEVPYLVPLRVAPWETAAREARFAETFGNGGKGKGGVIDGSWWWTDGAVALRCQGDVVAPGLDVVHPDTFARLLDTAERRETFWGPVTFEAGLDVRRSTVDPDTAVQERYIRLIATALPGAAWKIAGSLDPVHVHHEGRLMAVVCTVKVPPKTYAHAPTSAEDAVAVG